MIVLCWFINSQCIPSMAVGWSCIKVILQRYYNKTKVCLEVDFQELNDFFSLYTRINHIATFIYYICS